MGATAILSRSSFAACAGVAVHTQATVITKPTTRSTLITDPLQRDLRIHYLLRWLLCMRVREAVLALSLSRWTLYLLAFGACRDRLDAAGSGWQRRELQV